MADVTQFAPVHERAQPLPVSFLCAFAVSTVNNGIQVRLKLLAQGRWGFHEGAPLWAGAQGVPVRRYDREIEETGTVIFAFLQLAGGKPLSGRGCGGLRYPNLAPT
ncbi:hypothetical protein XNC2_2788 [Xenorhabdus nematophila AN6/1]|nr:hypothetical protein XNC2_2788 [Xenorhabdus nematophila AN6/1]